MKKISKSQVLFFLAKLLIYLICVGLGVTLALGIQRLYTSSSVLYAIIGAVMLAVILVAAFVNYILTVKLLKKYNSVKNYSKLYDEANDKFERAKNDYLAAEKAVIKRQNLIIACRVILSVWFVAMIAISSIATAQENSLRQLAVVIATIGCMLYPLPLLEMMVYYDKPSTPEHELSRNDYPLLYEMVDDAKRALNCTKSFKIYSVTGNGVSVSSMLNGFSIFVDAQEFSLLTRDEMYHVMLHEIAHVVNQDTKRSYQLDRFYKSFDKSFGGYVGKYLLGMLFIGYMIDKTAYTTFCTHFYEQNADRAVKEQGNGQVYINGTAKSMLFSLYEAEFNPKLSYHIFESEEPPKDYLYLDLQLFEEMKPAYGEKWNFILTHRIPARTDSHPTFLMRMEQMGVTSYDCSAVETDEKYVAEQQKLLKLENDNVYNNSKEGYEKRRKSFYLPLKEKLSNYERALQDGTILSIVQLTDYMEALYHVDRDKCLEIANIILSKNPQSGYANFYKGIILASRLQRECVDCLYVAVKENYNLADSALDAIAWFACNIGDQELLDKYRERIKSDVIGVQQRKEDLSLRNDDVYHDNNLDDEDFNAILDFIVEKGKGSIERVYSVSRGEGEDALNVYYIEFFKSAKSEECDKIYDDVFLLLDTYEEGKQHRYNFNLFTSSGVNRSRKANAFRATCGSLIYSAKDGKLPRKQRQK